MDIHSAMEKAKSSGGWVVFPDSRCFAVGYLPHYEEVSKLSPTPIGDDTLHCIPVDRRVGSIPTMCIDSGDLSHDILFRAKDLLEDYSVVTSDKHKDAIVKDYNDALHKRRDKFFSSMPGNVRSAYRSLS
jgi:hypothetical protein